MIHITAAGASIARLAVYSLNTNHITKTTTGYIPDGSGPSDEQTTEIGINASVALPARVGQGDARDAAPKAHVIKLRVMGAQTGFDVAQALAVIELGKGQAQKLIEAGETLHLVMALVAADATAKLGEQKQGYQLSKNRSATVHAPSLGSFRKWLKPTSEFKSISLISGLSSPLLVISCVS